MILTPQATNITQLIVQALHLFHHRINKRHISFAEVVRAGALYLPPWMTFMPAWVLMERSHNSEIA